MSNPQSPDSSQYQTFGVSELIYAVRWLIYDTFRQALASRIFWIMLAASVLCIVVCLGIHVQGGIDTKLPGDTELYTKDGKPLSDQSQAKLGQMTIWGLITVPEARSTADGVSFLQVLFASFVAGAIGFVMALIWTAGFLPDFLQPSSASVLLTKPIPRWALVVGKYLGVVTFVAFQIIVFFMGTWLALSLRTGVWQYGYLMSIPLFLLQFSVIFSFGVFIAVLTRSQVATIFGTILFWLVCWGMNVGRHFVVGFTDLAGQSAQLGPATNILSEVGYWIIPKPADMYILLEKAMNAGQSTQPLYDQPWFRVVEQQSMFFPELSLLSSIVFAVVMLGISAQQLNSTDY